ncbi:DUF2634 domain-containing protein [Cytobacillus praedii]|uniref:DUF2634 domain-containing protein n=1 Tax=Cytobacillus praedii TaxID=1742358 RepID=A0A4R1B029_9BACI|nr:DUF2634 domain-containing protein [Cytobacillus praedii]TCJ04089.1 DUF2634 domain-containing protein [Cytobacillus praedii]
MTIPQSELRIEELELMKMPSMTYKIDFQKKRMSGMTDQLAAIKQAVFIILHTERFKHMIYSGHFGIELENLIGTNPIYVKSELARRITEALLQDDRITSIEEFQFDFNDHNVQVTFTVETEYGRFQEATEVN